MKLRKLFILLGLCFCSWAGAQTLHLTGTMSGDKASDMKCYVSPLSVEKPLGEGVPLKVEDSHFEGEVPASPVGFYILYGVMAGGQIRAPFYCPATDKPVNLKVSIVDGCPLIDSDANNKALSAYNLFYFKKGQELWLKAKEMNNEQLFNFLKSFTHAADSITEQYKCDSSVKEYLQIWAYTVTCDNYNNIAHIMRDRTYRLPFTVDKLLKAPSEVLNTPMALFFYSSSSIIAKQLPQGSLNDKFTFLTSHFSCQPVCKSVEEYVLRNYVRSFNYAADFESGLAELTSVVEKYGLNQKLVKDFKVRKASIRGNEFPSGIVLTDVDGNKVEMSQFKGYYLYIDMWASWCGPCCREVPYLQKLEKELKNDKVKFVSISIDQKAEAWKAKMKALDMHGNQLLNQDNSLAEALNVTGIPHFLIYDPQGKLYEYKAPRPSSNELKELLESLR